MLPHALASLNFAGEVPAQVELLLVFKYKIVHANAAYLDADL
jgi:hypothetical protein